MKTPLSSLLVAITAALLSVVAPIPAAADAKDEALETDRGIAPEAAAQQRYVASVKAAEEALTKNLAQCDKMQPAERAECTREARELHDGDLARASDVLQRPR